MDAFVVVCDDVVVDFLFYLGRGVRSSYVGVGE